MIELRVVRCHTFFGRLRGLLGRPPPAAGTGLWLDPCGQVHSFGMRYAIDVVSLDGDAAVRYVERLEPWRLGRLVRGVRSVVELGAGQAAALGIVVGEPLCLIPFPADATKGP